MIQTDVSRTRFCFLGRLRCRPAEPFAARYKFFMDLAWITNYGYVAIVLLLMLGIVGLPVPDEALLTFVGSLSFKGDLQLVASLLTAFLGIACGITVSYELGRLFGLRVLTGLGGVFHIAQERMMEAQAWVRQWTHTELWPTSSQWRSQ